MKRKIVSAKRYLRDRKPANGNFDLRDRASWVYAEDKLTKEWRRFIARRIEPLVTLRGYHIDRKREVLAHAIRKLVLTGCVGAVVGDSRRTIESDTRQRVAVWDAIVAAGLARVCRGSESSGKQTRYQATDELLSMRKDWELNLLYDLQLARNSEQDEPTADALVVLRSGKIDPVTGAYLPDEERKKPIRFEDGLWFGFGNHIDASDPSIQRAYLRSIENDIERINRSNLAHGWRAYTVDEWGRRRAFQVNPSLKMVHVGAFFRAARLYTYGEWGGQALDKETRRTLEIDGEPTAELDFSGMATRMLYHMAKIDPPWKDVYRPRKVLPEFYDSDPSAADKAAARDLVKTVTNVCWNVSKRQTAVGVARKLIAADRRLRRIVDGEDITAAEIVDRIVDVHPKLKDRFFSEIGALLMTFDGLVMRRILRRFVAAKTPALGIHDAIVCKVSDVTFARKAMQAAYCETLGFNARIKRTY